MLHGPNARRCHTPWLHAIIMKVNETFRLALESVSLAPCAENDAKTKLDKPFPVPKPRGFQCKNDTPQPGPPMGHPEFPVGRNPRSHCYQK